MSHIHDGGKWEEAVLALMKSDAAAAQDSNETTAFETLARARQLQASLTYHVDSAIDYIRNSQSRAANDHLTAAEKTIEKLRALTVKI